MSRFTIDSAPELLFGHCVHSLKASLPYPHNAKDIATSAENPESRFANDFSAAFLDAQHAVIQRERLGPIWPLFEIFGDKARKPMKIVNAFIEPIVADVLRKKEAAGKQEKSKDSQLADDETLLDHLVQVTSDPKIIKDET